MATLYKICREAQWREAEAAGGFAGGEVDRQDGYIHLSAIDQVRETADKHFTGQSGLVLVAVDGDRLGGDLRWEVSRGGALFPHLYGGPLALDAVEWVKPLPLGDDGRHTFPPLDL